MNCIYYFPAIPEIATKLLICAFFATLGVVMIERVRNRYIGLMDRVGGMG